MSHSQQLPEIPHHYGERVHLLSTPFFLSMLAQLGHPNTTQPQFNQWIDYLYLGLMQQVLSHHFPLQEACIPTRMQEQHPLEGCYRGKTLCPQTPVVIASLARAGTLPGHTCFSLLNHLLPPPNIRQDHFYIGRKVNEQQQVVGVDMSGSKIGGGIAGAIVLLPDPMGATGNTIAHVLEHYKHKVHGTGASTRAPHSFVALHLIITPEYLRKVRREHPDLHVYALRLDRGLSPQQVLNTLPGTHWEEERGLNDIQYIVPGAGGLGELMNNAYC